ncbi:Uncharacterized protein PODLI_1B031328 [Podarcis lilfordi]|uniref:Uncharacterized protein n=1 Tax=Podarcis lilfordi TaxID=74358 RepID=A0AA35PL42_9SAUR|nr:Uncharacterized protein PODLI_1B031328 [Podarcis lilfordi]
MDEAQERSMVMTPGFAASPWERLPADPAEEASYYLRTEAVFQVELAVPVINTKAPPTPLHLQVNLKKLQLERERQAVRDQENRSHSARLWHIKQSPGRVDNWNFYCIHSLNWGKRQRDLAHIYWENQELAKRLEGRRSELAQERWQQDWHKEQLIRSSIARYPRETVSCQARNRRRRQACQNNHIPLSASGRRNPSINPSRTREPFSSKNHSRMGKSFWGSESESTQEEEITTTKCSPSSLGKRDLAGQLSKETSLLAKIASGGFCHRHVDGSLVRTDLAGGGALEKPRGEAMMISSKPRTSVCLRGNLGPLETSLMPASGDTEKKAAFSSTKNI